VLINSQFWTKVMKNSQKGGIGINFLPFFHKFHSMIVLEEHLWAAESDQHIVL